MQLVAKNLTITSPFGWLLGYKSSAINTKVDNLLLFGTECQSIQPKRICLKNNKKWIISKLSTLLAYLKSLSDNTELVSKVDLKQRIWTSTALRDPNADQ